MTTAKPDSPLDPDVFAHCARHSFEATRRMPCSRRSYRSMSRSSAARLLSSAWCLPPSAATSVIIRPLVGHWADRLCGESRCHDRGLVEFPGRDSIAASFHWIGTTMLANGFARHRLGVVSTPAASRSWRTSRRPVAPRRSLGGLRVGCKARRRSCFPPSLCGFSKCGSTVVSPRRF